ncbi:MAG: methyltransferase domain-containing protein, partial [Ginsengibacter sp.]
MNNTKRFSDRVSNYVKYRPAYPKEIIGELFSRFNLNANNVIADIGSGTGILTALFLKNGNKVFAVEPNNEMRNHAENTLAEFPNFYSINGTAEDTTLPDKSIDMIVAAQAFHWFDQPAANKEFKRIAVNNAPAVLIWNDRQVSTAFEMAYEQLLRTYGTDYTTVNHRNVSEEQLGAFYYPEPYTVIHLPNYQVFNFEGLKGRLLSSSYIPNDTHPDYKKMMQELQIIY